FPLTLTHILERTEKIYPGVEIVSRLTDKSIHRSNYACVCKRARALAAALAASGIERGDRVATLMWNHVSHLEAYLRIPAAGCVPHTLNPRLHPEELAYIIQHAGDRLLFVEECLLPLYEKLRAKIRVENVIVVPSNSQTVPAGYEEYDSFLSRGDPAYQLPSL